MSYIGGELGHLVLAQQNKLPVPDFVTEEEVTEQTHV